MKGCLSGCGSFIMTIVKLVVLMAVIAFGYLTFQPQIDTLIKQITDVAPLTYTPAATPELQGARRYLPNLEGCRQVDGQGVANAAAAYNLLNDLLDKWNILTLAGVPRDMAEIMACYSAKNALTWRAYQPEGNPASFGIVMVADLERVQDPKILWTCVTGMELRTPVPEGWREAAGLAFHPCAGQLVGRPGPQDSKLYLFTYAATDCTMCGRLRNSLPNSDMFTKYGDCP